MKIDYSMQYNDLSTYKHIIWNKRNAQNAMARTICFSDQDSDGIFEEFRCHMHQSDRKWPKATIRISLCFFRHKYYSDFWWEFSAKFRQDKLKSPQKTLSAPFNFHSWNLADNNGIISRSNVFHHHFYLPEVKMVMENIDSWNNCRVSCSW